MYFIPNSYVVLNSDDFISSQYDYMKLSKDFNISALKHVKEVIGPEYYNDIDWYLDLLWSYKSL